MNTYVIEYYHGIDNEIRVAQYIARSERDASVKAFNDGIVFVKSIRAIK